MAWIDGNLVEGGSSVIENTFSGLQTSNAWGNLVSENVDSTKRYLVVCHVMFEGATSGWHACAINSLSNGSQIGANSANVGLQNTMIIENEATITIMAYGTATSVSGNYQILEI